VKQSWEEEDKPKPVPAVAKLKTDKRKAVDIKGAKKSLQDDRLADPLTEKLGQQRLVEESDYQHTTELFGAQKSSGGGLTLDDFIPKSEYDFLEYAELLAQKLRPFEVRLLHFIITSCFAYKGTVQELPFVCLLLFIQFPSLYLPNNKLDSKNPVFVGWCNFW
jgi:hypothetical protein